MPSARPVYSGSEFRCWRLVPDCVRGPLVRYDGDADQTYWRSAEQRTLIVNGPVFSQWPSIGALEACSQVFKTHRHIGLYTSCGVRSVCPPRPEKPWPGALVLYINPCFTPHLRLEVHPDDNVYVTIELTGMRDLRSLDDWEILVHPGVQLDFDWVRQDYTFQAGEGLCCMDIPGRGPQLVIRNSLNNSVLPVPEAAIPQLVKTFARCIRCVP